MKDIYILSKCLRLVNNNDSIVIDSKVIAPLYEQYYDYGDLTNISCGIT